MFTLNILNYFFFIHTILSPKEKEREMLLFSRGRILGLFQNGRVCEVTIRRYVTKREKIIFVNTNTEKGFFENFFFTFESLEYIFKRMILSLFHKVFSSESIFCFRPQSTFDFNIHTYILTAYDIG